MKEEVAQARADIARSLIGNPAVEAAVKEALMARFPALEQAADLDEDPFEGDEDRQDTIYAETCSPQKLEDASASTDPRILMTVARHPAAPVNVLERLTLHRDTRVREIAWMNPGLPAEFLVQASNHDRKLVRQCAAANPSMPHDGLRRLSQDEIDTVRAAVAVNPSLPLDVFAILADDPMPAVRAELARHPACPVDVLRRLANDSEADVLVGVAAHRACPHDLLMSLVQSHDRRVRAAVIGNEHLPSENLLPLLKSEPTLAEWFGAGGQPAPDLDRPISTDLDPIFAALQRKDLPTNALDYLVDQGLPVGDVADHPNLSPALVDRVFRQGDIHDRFRIYASFPLTPERIKRSATENPEEIALASGLFVHQILESEAPHPALLHMFARSTGTGTREMIARHRNLPADLISQLAGDPEPRVRSYLAENPCCDEKTLIRLAGDTEYQPAMSVLDRRPPVSEAVVSAFCDHLFSCFEEDLKAYAEYTRKGSKGSIGIPQMFRNLSLALTHPRLPLRYIEPLLEFHPDADPDSICLGNENYPTAVRLTLLTHVLEKKPAASVVLDIAANPAAPPELIERIVRWLYQPA